MEMSHHARGSSATMVGMQGCTSAKDCPSVSPSCCGVSMLCQASVPFALSTPLTPQLWSALCQLPQSVPSDSASYLASAPAAHGITTLKHVVPAGAAALMQRAPSHTPSEGDSGTSLPASHAASRSPEVQPPVAEHSEVSLAGNLEVHLEEGAAAAAAARQSQAAVGIPHASGLVLVQSCIVIISPCRSNISSRVTSDWNVHQLVYRSPAHHRCSSTDAFWPP